MAPRKTRMRSHPTESIGFDSKEIGSHLPNVKRYPKVGSEVNNVRVFSPSGKSAPGTLGNTNYPFFNFLNSRLKKH